MTILTKSIIRKRQQPEKTEKNRNKVTVRSRTGLVLAMQGDRISDEIARVLLSDNPNEK